MQEDPDQLLSFTPLLEALPSLLPSALHSHQSIFTRRTSGHCLGTFIAENFLFSPVKCGVPHYYPSTLSSLSHSFSFKVFVANQLALSA
jgi:hypothetical protein